MSRMSEGEREPVTDWHDVQFIGTICQQERSDGPAEVDGSGASLAGS